MPDKEGKIEKIIRSQLEEDGYELLHVEVRPEGGSTILRIYVDKPDGVSIDDCAAASRKISVLLDVEDPFEGNYTLEVSSPGIERPLFSPKDYLRFQGREVKLVTKTKIDNRRKFTGKIVSLQNEIVTLSSGGELIKIAYEEIKKAHLVYDFNENK